MKLKQQFDPLSNHVCDPNIPIDKLLCLHLTEKSSKVFRGQGFLERWTGLVKMS